MQLDGVRLTEEPKAPPKPTKPALSDRERAEKRAAKRAAEADKWWEHARSIFQKDDGPAKVLKPVHGTCAAD